MSIFSLSTYPQVLDEIGINLNSSLVSAPGQKVAAAAPAAAVQQPVAQPMGAAEGGWPALAQAGLAFVVLDSTPLAGYGSFHML